MHPYLQREIFKYEPDYAIKTETLPQYEAKPYDPVPKYTPTYEIVGEAPKWEPSSMSSTLYNDRYFLILNLIS